MRPFAFLAALLSAAFLAADAPIRQITPPAGQSQAVLQAPVSRGTWVVVADEDLAAVAPQLVADGSLAILQAKPGRYHVRWRQGPLKPWQATTIDLGGVVPPGPGPTPPKPEPPKPVPAAVAFCVLIEESAEPPDGVDMPAIRLSGSSGEIAAACKAAGIQWRCVDRDVKGPDGKPPRELTPFLAEAKDRTLPWIVATGKPDSSGAAAIVISEPCPATVAGVLKLLGAK
jgi:hypothetical protein